MTRTTGDGVLAGDGGAPLPFSRILITGGHGFVGRHLVSALRARLSDTAILFIASRTPGSDQPDVIAFDLEDPASIDEAVSRVRPDLVIHLAAQSSVGQSIGSGARTWAINMGGSLALALALAKHCPDATLLYPSSAEVYGSSFNHGVVTETSPLAPQSVYGRSKAATEAMFADVLPATTRLLVVRPSNHIGPGQDERFVVPSFAVQIVAIERGEQAPTMLVGNLDAQRDFMDVRDVVAGYIALLGRASDLPLHNVFNLSSGTTVSIASVLADLRALSLVEVAVETDPKRLRASEVPVAAIDSTAFRDAMNWRPRHTLRETLAEIVDGLRRRVEWVSADL